MADQPGDYHLNMLLVNILNQKKDWAAAEARLTQILAGQPGDAYALASRGFARLNQARRSLAAEDFRRALEQNPGADLLANVRGALNQIKQAEVLDRASGRQPRQRVALGGDSGPDSAGGRLLAIQKLVFEQQLERAAQKLNQIMGTALASKEKGLWYYLRAEVLWR